MTKQIVAAARRWRVAVGSNLPAFALGALLSACGGGGSEADGSGANSAVPQTSAAAEPCPSPITADCIAPSGHGLEMTGGRQSDYALSVHNGRLILQAQRDLGNLSFASVDFRFRGGTTIEDDSELYVLYASSLHSDVIVQSTGQLFLYGAMTGDATNHGTMVLTKVVGNVMNDGVLTPAAVADTTVSTHVEGVFSQSSAGTLDAVIATAGGFVSVTGRADIDGTLRLVQYWDSWGLPTVPFTVHVLHADGGVYGRFSNSASPGLLVTGNFRYLANDVYFDVTDISAAK